MDLFPYQCEGVSFLLRRRRAYLADEMGLGKTVQAVCAAGELDAFDPGMIWHTVVVCPASVQENWRREWRTWGGPGKLDVVSYSKLIRLPLETFGVPSLVILDEAHYCKSPGAKRSKAALKLAAKADRAWLLSGTPVPNDVRELYTVFKYLWPDYMFPTSARKWLERFCLFTDTEYGPRVWGNKPAVKAELRPALREVMLRRRLRDVAMELPPLRVNVQYLDKDSTLDEQILELAGDMEDPEHLSTLRRLLGEYKAPLVARLLREEIEDGQYRDIVVLYHHTRTGEVLREALSGMYAKVYGFDGSTPSARRQEEIDAFQRFGGIFLAQQGAAGTGITLTRASEIVLVEPAWTPSENEQAIKRIHRIGQEAPCRARIFAVPGSMDEALMQAVARKTAMVKEILNEG